MKPRRKISTERGERTLPSNGNWYIWQSAQDNSLRQAAWGTAGDIRVPVFTEGRFINYVSLSSCYFASSTYAPPANDPRLIRSETTLNDTTQKAKTETVYDLFNNPTEVKEYDYGTGAFGALMRRTVTTYASASSTINGTDYTCANCTTATGFSVYQRRIPLETSIFDAGGVEKSRTVFEYDNYATDSRHAALTERTNATALCLLPALAMSGNCGQESTAAYTTRGNLTGISAYGSVANLTEAVTTSAQYDVIGNLVKTIDAKDNIATVGYADNFGAPNAEARTTVAPTQLNGKQTFAFATSATNAAGWISYAQYDYFLGAAIDGEDINGVVASGYFNDLLDRPTQIINAANNTSFKQQTTFIYDDANRQVETKGDLNALNDNLLKSESIYDGLGRTVETRRYESDGTYIATKSVPFEMVQDPETSI